MNIIHVTPHLGGGVGRVLLNYLAHARRGDDIHSLYCLDYANDKAKKAAAALAIKLHENTSCRHQVLAAAMSEADIVFIHWWNHPLLYEWLINAPHPDCRVLLWSHVSGLTAPQMITEDLAMFPDIFAVASPCSFNVPALCQLKEHDKNERLRLLFSCAGLEHIEMAQPKAHNGLRISYLGTVDYVKMHPDFIEMSLRANIDKAVFPVAGGPKEKEFLAELLARGVQKNFEVLGHIENIAEFLSFSDIFGYPLNPAHYGTGEQTLIEAQAAGAPPVVLAGGAEEFVVEHNITGLVAKNEFEYSSCLNLLANNKDLRLSLSQTAMLRARQRFSIDSTVERINSLYLELMEKPKKPKRWPSKKLQKKPLAPSDIFLHSHQGSFAAGFSKAAQKMEKHLSCSRSCDCHHEFLAGLNEACFSETRGSVFHYRSFFPNDKKLNYWCDILLQQKTLSGEDNG